jgi:hypothetical protein
VKLRPTWQGAGAMLQSGSGVTWMGTPMTSKINCVNKFSSPRRPKLPPCLVVYLKHFIRIRLYDVRLQMLIWKGPGWVAHFHTLPISLITVVCGSTSQVLSCILFISLFTALQLYDASCNVMIF